MQQGSQAQHGPKQLQGRVMPVVAAKHLPGQLVQLHTLGRACLLHL